MKKIVLLLFTLLSIIASAYSQTTSNSTIAVQPTLDATAPLPFNPLFRFDSSGNLLYFYNGSSWVAVSSGGGTDDQTASEVTTALSPTNYTAASNSVEDQLVGIDAALAGAGAATSAYVFSATAPAINKFWIDSTTDNGTGFYVVKVNFNSVWVQWEYYCSVGDRFYDGNYNILNWSQSNGQPRGADTDNPDDKVEPTNLVGYNYVSANWEVVDTRLAAYSADGTDQGAGGDKNWYMIQVAKMAEEKNFRITLVHDAQGGSPIDYWLTPENSNGDTYLPNNALKWNTLMAKLTGSGFTGTFDFIISAHGETDGVNGMIVSAYRDSWFKLQQQFLDLDQVDESTVFISVLLNTKGAATAAGAERMNGFYYGLAGDDYSNIKLIQNDLDSDVDDSDETHWTGYGHVRIGKRIFKTMEGLLNYSPNPQYGVQTLVTDEAIDLGNSVVEIDVRGGDVEITDILNVSEGWRGGFAVTNNPYPNDNVAILTPDRFKCVNDDGEVVFLKELYRNHSTGAFYKNGVVTLDRCGAAYNAGLEVALELGPKMYLETTKMGLAQDDAPATITDYSVNGFDMTATGVTIEKNAINGYDAMRFDGVNSGLLLNTQDFKDARDSPYTFAMVVHADDVPDIMPLIGPGFIGGASIGNSLTYRNDSGNEDKLIHYVDGGSGPSQVNNVASNATLADTWYIIVLRSDPSNVVAADRSLIGYNNLNFVTANSTSDAPTTTVDDAGFMIGYNSLSPTPQRFSGLIAEFLSYDYLLNDDQLNTLLGALEFKYQITTKKLP